MKWYVVQVRSGHEKKIAEKCRTMISKDILSECFIPEYIHKKNIWENGMMSEISCLRGISL